jgi:hypothetical protein
MLVIIQRLGKTTEYLCGCWGSCTKSPLLTFPPEGRENKRKIEKTKTTQAEQTPPLWRGGWVGSRI